MQQKLIFLAIFLLGVTKILGQPLPLPTVKCWDFQSDQISSNKTASDNDSTIIIYQDNSRIVALDKSGKIIWSNEIGGELKSKILVEKKQLIFIIQNEKTDFIIRSSSLETGLTIWERKINADKSVQNIEIITTDKYLIVSDRQSINILGFQDGTLITSDNFNTKILSNLIAEAESEYVYFINKQNALISYSLQERKASILFKLEKSADKIYLTEKGKLIIMNNLGQVSQYNRLTKKKEWSFRAGGSINSIEEFSDYYVITSFDNHIYYLSAKNGKLIWRKRMDNRVKIAVAQNQSQIISSVINSQVTSILELKKGKTVNQINLANNFYFTNEPIVLNNLLILSTNNGLVAYSFKGC